MKSSKLTPVVRIVDDDEKVLASEAFLVNMAGFRTSTYNSAKEFLEKDDPLFPGCVILDIRMPEMDGVSVCQRLRGLSGVPVIFLSAYANIFKHLAQIFIPELAARTSFRLGDT